MNIKKLLASTFALLICCELVSTPQITDSINSIIASSEDMYSGSCGENATFSFDEATGTLTISGTGDMDSTNDWQDYAESIKSIIIEDDITSIGMYAFYNCTSLTEITIPNSIVSIGDSAFGNCTSLTEITIPDSVNDIAYAAFDNTPFIDNYHDDLIILGSVLYKYQGNDAIVTIPNSVTSIGYGAFEDCTSLTEINIPNSVTSIDECAFYCCTSLKKITIPNSVTWIGALSLGYNEYNYITQKRDKIEDFTIYGFKGSTAETYATENDFNFIAIDNDTQPTTKDILKLKKYILGISNDITNLDFNQDNNVNILDLNVAKQSILY